MSKIKGKIYKVGIYARLSRNSNTYRNKESYSIENQISMLNNFINMMPNWVLKNTYIDNGVSGTNFSRKGFQLMMDDVRNKYINLVLVKDLSRFGRNYLQVGKYLEEELPGLDCRFVALADGIDTALGESDLITFQNAINDFYLKDVSNRIKCVLENKALNGHKPTGAVPYGYKKSMSDRSRLVVDEPAAKVVKIIFCLRAKGKGYTYIAGVLNKNNILPPRLYYCIKHNRKITASCTNIWTIRTVKLILNNEIYIGNTISLKRGTRSYCDRRVYMRDKKDWIRVNNTHTPIVDIELWNKVQHINIKNQYKASNKITSKKIFSGLLVCSDCKAKICYNSSTIKDQNGRVVSYGGYNCRTYFSSGKSACSTHSISEINLKNLVLSTIQELQKEHTYDVNILISLIKKRLSYSYKSINKSYLKQCQLLERELYTLDNEIDKLYESKVLGNLSIETFNETAYKLEEERCKLENKLNVLRKEKEAYEIKLQNSVNLDLIIKQNTNINEVNRELLQILINKIEIGKKTVINGQLSQEISIYYN